MDVFLRAFSSVGVLLFLIFGVVLLRRLGLLREEYGPMCSTLVTKVTLPALIIMSLTHAEFNWDYGKMGVLLITVSVVCLGFGWLIAKLFRVEAAGVPAVILASGFSSSSVLGVSVISELFPDDKQLITDTVVLSALGMMPVLLTLGTMITIYYGAGELTPAQRRKASLSYFRSPIFIALVAGIVLANVTDHEGSVVHSLVDGLRMVSAGNTLMVLLAMGLFLKLHDFRKILGLTACVAAVNLILMPLMTLPPAHMMSLPHWEIEVLALEAAMPAITLPVVLCNAYGADARLAARLVFATIVLSVFTIPLIVLISSQL